MFDFLAEAFGSRVLRLPRRWDGMNVSAKGTLQSAFRVESGALPGVTGRWLGYHTAVSDRHLWIGRTSVTVIRLDASHPRRPAPRERSSLHADFVVMRVGVNGAALEWALRESAVAEVVRRLGAVEMS